MRIINVKDYNEMSRKAADILSSEVILNEKAILGLATGSTPLGMYKEIIKDYKARKLDFTLIKTFNLDEYWGISKANKNSYYFYMRENFFNHLNIKEENINIPNGVAVDIEQECQNYENMMEESGGIDIQVLGIGRNGHIGFNEPGSSFQCGTHVVELEQKTIEDNARFFDSIEAVPRKAISMGVKSIMKAKKILLLACGEEKAEAIYKTVKGDIDSNVPASILKLHENVIIIVDEGAGKLL